jgi:hypothetical protein
MLDRAAMEMLKMSGLALTDRLSARRQILAFSRPRHLPTG